MSSKKTSKNKKESSKGKKMAIRVMVGIALAFVAIGLLVLAGYGHYQWIFVIETIFCSISMHEIMGVSGCKNKVLTTITMIVAAFLPIYNAFELNRFVPLSDGELAAIYTLAMLVIMLKMYDKTRFENVAIGVFCSIAISQSVSCIFFTFRYMTGKEYFSTSSAIFTILMAMFSAWLCDTFALFGGMAFGKHKMAPNISPKKTIEGAISGVVGTTVFAAIAFAICNAFYFKVDTIKLWMVLIGIPIACVAGMCGDLAASVIKRNYGVKDFGTLFPEHGGAMDRIDSFLFTMPTTYLYVRILCELIEKR